MITGHDPGINKLFTPLAVHLHRQTILLEMQYCCHYSFSTALQK